MSTTALDILIRAKDSASRTLRGVGNSVEKTGKQAHHSEAELGRFGRTSERAFDSLKEFGKGIAATAGIAAVGEMAHKSFEAFEQLEVGEKRLAFGLRQVGEGRKHLEGLVDWSKEFSKHTGINEADIVAMQSKLTVMGGSFLKSLGPRADGVIKKVTSGMINLGSATGKSASLLLRSLGPAILNQPKTALTQLQKYGVLTDRQVAKVTALTKAGKNHAASLLEINALQKKFAGVAHATETPMDKVKNGINQLELSIGRLLGRGFEWLVSEGWPKLKAGVTEALQKAQPFFDLVKVAGANIMPTLKASLSSLLPSLKSLWSAAKPFLKVLGAIIALAVIGAARVLPLLIKIITRLAKILIGGLTLGLNIARGAIRLIIAVFSDMISAGKRVVGWVESGFGRMVSFVKGLPGKISHAASGMWGGIKSGFKSAINWVIDRWNGFVSHLRIPGFHVLGHGFDGVNLGSGLQIPHLANGGIVRRPTLALVGEAGPESIEPLHRRKGDGSDTVVVSFDRRRFVKAGDYEVKYGAGV